MKLRFSKEAVKPSVPGTIWFNESNNRIEVILDGGQTKVYGSEITTVTFNNNILTINKIDGTNLTIDLSGLSSVTELENSLATKLDKIQVNGTLLDTTSVSIENGAGINLITWTYSNGTKGLEFSTFPFSSTEISSGTISLDHLPKGAIERLFVFATEARALASADVSEGDTVQITDNDNQMYFCVSSTGTFNERFRPYTAGSATSVPWSGIVGKPDYYTPDNHTHTVSDITNFPEIPTKTSDLTNNSGYITSSALNSYAQTSAIPTNVSQLSNDSGYLNSSDLEGYALSSEVPTKTSQLENDSGFLTKVPTPDLSSYAKKTDIPESTSELLNDSGYITTNDLSSYAKTTDLPTKLSALTNDSNFITSSALSPYAKSTELADYLKRTELTFTNNTTNTSTTELGSLKVGFNTYRIYGPKCISSIGGQTGAITLGNGLSMSGNTLSATAQQSTDTTEE